MNHSNNAFSVLNGSITNVATAITVATGTGSRFPASNFMVTLVGYDGSGNENAWEICLCSSRSGDVLTVVRGREGTTAVAWASATRIENRLTAGTMGNLLYLDQGGTVTGPVTLMNGAYTAFKVGPTGLVSIGGEAGSADSRFTITNGGAVGLEFSQTAIAGQNRILSYNRTGMAFVPLSMAASEVRFNISGTDVVTINGSGVTGITRAMVGLADAVTGPASSTDNTIPRFDGTTGKLLQGSGVVVDDSNRLGIGRTPNYELDVQANITGVARFSTTAADMFFRFETSGGTNFIGYSGSALQMYAGGTVKATLDASGSLTLNAGTLGYGAGAGGTVTQVTSKSTGVTITPAKPNGLITLNGATLNSGATVAFTMSNSLIAAGDGVFVNIYAATATADAYRVFVDRVDTGSARIVIQNYSGSNLSEAFTIKFTVIKGSTT